MRVGVPVVDLCAGMNAAIGILMALAERERSGAGQSLEVALYDTGIALLHPHAPNFFMSGKAPTITGDAHPNVAPYDQYETRTRTMFVGVGNERQFRRLCEELGRPELADDARFGTNADRLTNRGALDDALRPLFGREDAEGLSARLLARGVPAGAVQPVPEVFAHPHTRHREMVVERDGYRGTGIPIKLGRTPGRVRATPPAYGEGQPRGARQGGLRGGGDRRAGARRRGAGRAAEGGMRTAPSERYRPARPRGRGPYYGHYLTLTI